MKRKIVRSGTVVATDLVPVASLRKHVRALDDTDDDLLEDYLYAALDYVQHQTNRILGTSTVTLILDREDIENTRYFHGVNDIVSVDSVEYLDNLASYQTLDTSIYALHTDYPASFTLVDDLPTDAEDDYDESLIKITLTAGASLATLPRQYKMAVYLLVGHWYMNREEVVIGTVNSQLKMGVENLLSSVTQH